MKQDRAHILFIFVYVLFYISRVSSQGADWSDEDTIAVKEKLLDVFNNKNHVLKEYEKLHPDHPDYLEKTKPNAPKMLRLGFHDCLPHHKNGQGEELINGCNGCLNPVGMGIDMIKEYEADKNSFNGPDIVKTNNNGLMYTADILEEIYTNPEFPKHTTVINPSLKEAGKSRADLWAFAATVALEWGIENNNAACDGNFENTDACAHLREGDPNCKIKFTEPIKFQTGRKDCVADPDASRPYFTSNSELHPNPHENGRHISNFLRDKFGFTARESVAIMGAHSFGKFNSEVTFHRYQWTRRQAHLFNNQLFRHITGKPQYFLECNPVFKLVGDSNGNPANITWIVRASGNSQGGGPFQWFHAYNRCPASNNCSSIVEDFRTHHSLSVGAEPVTPPECCENLKEGQKCQPDCVRPITNDETAIAAEVGLYYKFHFNSTTGQPLDCPGFESEHWNIESWKNHKGTQVVPDCQVKEDYTPDGPDGEKLYELVEEFADDQDAWISDFMTAFIKMLSNGYNNSEVSSYSLIDGPNVWHSL